MNSIDLYNLDVGDPRRLLGPSPFRVGPFVVRLAENYTSAVAQLRRPEQLQVSLSGPVNQLTRSVTRIAESGVGGWHITASATLEADAPESSLLARSPVLDGGVRDLCEILTFLTGRRVATADMHQFFNPDGSSERACIPEETFATADLAWRNRTRIATNGLSYAVLLENSAIDFWLMQVRAYLHNAVLNILVDKWPGDELTVLPVPAGPQVTRQTRNSLADHVAAALTAFDGLQPEAREAYIPILRARVQQGPSSLHDAVMRLLRFNLGIIPVDADASVTRRVQFMNRVRNTMTHSGQMPELPGLEQSVADRYTAVIVAGVVPTINQLAIGRLFGFTSDGLGSLSQHPIDLQRFFSEGNWRGQPLDLMSFEEWVNSPEALI